MNKNDPKKYHAMSAPRPIEESNAEIKAFLDAVVELREKHKLANVSVLVGDETLDGIVFSQMSMGHGFIVEKMLSLALSDLK